MVVGNLGIKYCDQCIQNKSWLIKVLNHLKTGSSSYMCPQCGVIFHDKFIVY